MQIFSNIEIVGNPNQLGNYLHTFLRENRGQMWPALCNCLLLAVVQSLPRNDG